MAQTAIVVGAGMAGLTAARELEKCGYAVTILERLRTPGGRARTESFAGFEIDIGAGFIAGFYSNTLRMISEVGLSDSIVPIKSKGAVVRAGALSPFGPGMRPLSLKSRCRLAQTMFRLLWHWAAIDLHALEKTAVLDSGSVTDYCRGHLTPELLDWVIEPVMAGTCYWVPETTSQIMLFILLKASLNMGQLTLQHGIGQLTTAMAKGLNITCGAAVTSIAKDSNGLYRVEVTGAGGESSYTADAVVCAVEGTRVAEIVSTLSPEQRHFFEMTTYSSSIVTSLATRGRPIADCNHVLIPRASGRNYVTNITSLAAKNLKQVKEGCDLLRIYTTASAAKSLSSEPDERIVKLVLAEIAEKGAANVNLQELLFSRIDRWEYALPDFGVGHFRRLARFLRASAPNDRLVFAGDYIGGPWIEGAITSGLAAAKRLTTHA